MKTLLAACVLLALSAIPAAEAREPDRKPDVPALHQIRTATLSPSYSCRDKDEFARGYEATALFLMADSRSQNSPELLFNGACGADDYFTASTAGDDMALVADLGSEIDLTEMTASKAFNVRRVLGYENQSKFVQDAPVVLGHTYAVLVNKSDLRALFFVKVIAYERNKSVGLQYAIKQYQRVEVVDQSDGFAWEAPSAESDESNAPTRFPAAVAPK